MTPNMRRKQGFFGRVEFWLAIAQLLVLLIGGLVAAVHFTDQTKEMFEDVRTIRDREERVEKYLSSRDSHYWQIVKDLSSEGNK